MSAITRAVAGGSYFKGRAYAGDRVFPWIVWNGVREYRNVPPPALLIAENLNGNIVFARTQNHSTGFEAIDAVLKAGADAVVIWARDHRTYCAIVTNLQAQPGGWLQ